MSTNLNRIKKGLEYFGSLPPSKWNPASILWCKRLHAMIREEFFPTAEQTRMVEDMTDKELQDTFKWNVSVSVPAWT